MSYACRRCHLVRESDEGPCPNPMCLGFYRAINQNVEGQGRSTFAKAAESKTDFWPTTIEGLDVVLGGGLVESTTILLGGTYGAGKSTLAVAMTAKVAEKYGPCLYVSAEEGVEGVHRIVHRLGCETEKVELLGGQTNFWQALRHAEKTAPLLFVVDSLTKFSDGPKDDKVIVMALCKWARKRKGVALLINQLAKSGDFKGSTEGVHGTDVVLTLGFACSDDMNAPAGRDIRILYSQKSRLGATKETYWKMDEEGRLVCIPARPPKAKRKRA